MCSSDLLLEVPLADLIDEQATLATPPIEDAMPPISIRVTKGSTLCCIASVIAVILYTGFSLLTNQVDIGTLITLYTIAIMMQLFLHLFFSHAIKTDDFVGLAGYDRKVEYNIAELKKFLVKLDQILSVTSLFYVVLIILTSYIKVDWVGVLLILYTGEFIGTIFYFNYISIDQMLIHEVDQKRARASYFSAGIYCILMLVTVLETFYIAMAHSIENNSSRAMVLAVIIIEICVVATIGLLIESVKIKKLDLLEHPYKPSRTFIICMILTVILMIVMFFAC